ncbi:MAG: FdtA/QdtA family cupin domain-containing protein [Candidatus Eremiobacteraeota bacterium]|nr:FdtA/QdtA family cupin domain-containing protein [Candidatus Eremiobacteraeota bacterium]
MSVADCRLIELPRIHDPRGNLTFIESERHVPFALKRLFYLYDVPGGATRAGHALKTCHQFLIATSGSFDVSVDDGTQAEVRQLNRSHYGLYIPPMIWRELSNFSSNSICMVLASEFYSQDDYYREYPDFLAGVRDRAT